MFERVAVPGRRAPHSPDSGHRSARTASDGQRRPQQVIHPGVAPSFDNRPTLDHSGENTGRARGRWMMRTPLTFLGRLALGILVPLAVTVGLAAEAAPAGASPTAAASTLGHVVSVANDGDGLSNCAATSTGVVDCWGYNGSGQLGNGTTTSSDVPVRAIGIRSATAVVGDRSGDSFCALLSTGRVDCWGDNEFGELGNGTTTTFLLPVAVNQITTATRLFAGDYGFCALLSTGHLSCWGDNQNGELGNGTTTTSDVPVPVSGIENAVDVTAGNFDNCALLSTGRVQCWGYNGFGQLGNGTSTSSDVPVAVTGITAAASLTTDGDGDSYCAAISNGKVSCWGYNGFGQLGNGTITTSLLPVTVHGVTGATAVTGANGADSFCVRLSSGKVDCWGNNANGELGNGTMTTDSLPVPVKQITTATTVFAGDFGFCALLSTGHLNCWGDNANGELGNGSTTGSDVPVAVNKIGDAVRLIPGFVENCALLSTGHIDCWGYNGDGQLGNGTTTSSDVPVAVLAAS